MKCKWLSDDFNEVCTNADCDCVADFCPCVNWPQICRHAELVEDDTESFACADSDVQDALITAEKDDIYYDET